MPYPRIIREMIESRCKIGSKSKSHLGCPDKARFLMAFAPLCSPLLNKIRIPVTLPALFTSFLSRNPQFKDPEI
jgi:hypothetical protein